MRKLLPVLMLLLAACQAQTSGYAPVQLPPLAQPADNAAQAWPVIAPLSPPEGLRPCCAFGYNLRASLLGIPVPWYQVSNVLDAAHTGVHHYNNQLLYTLATLVGINGEHNGMVYTRRGGFIDLAHLRDTADNTLWLFSQIWPDLGQPRRVALSDELGERVIELRPFPPPASAVDRYNLALRLAAHLAFELAAWHEVAQWYGYQSVPGFSEGVSAFSPEDLYSNLLGARLAIDLLNAGEAGSLRGYEQAMSRAIPQALAQLQAQPPSVTRFHFDMIDGSWWNSRCRLPQKFLLRYRSYSVSDRRLPSRPWENLPPLRLSLPQQFNGVPLGQAGRLSILPGRHMARLPAPLIAYHYRDFAALAERAQRADGLRLALPGRHCN